MFVNNANKVNNKSARMSASTDGYVDNQVTDGYEIVRKQINEKVNKLKGSKQRYQIISERPSYAPEQPQSAEEKLAFGKYLTNWRGIPMMKDCREMVIYQSMLGDVKPRTIIELGTYTGGSALWLCDQMKAMELPCHVYTIDKYDQRVSPLTKSHCDITCITGDATDIEELIPTEMLASLPHPWLVMEDCDVNVLGTLEHFACNMITGDYFAVEDTNETSPYWTVLIDNDVAEERCTDEKNPLEMLVGKHKILVNFLQKHKDEFKVDSFYTDYFGFNGTNTWDGFIRKM